MAAYSGPRTWPANPADTENYTLDLEEWLIAGLTISPELFPEARKLIGAAGFYRDLNRWIWMAMEKLYTHNGLHNPQAIHPLSVSLGVTIITRGLSAKPYPYTAVAAYLSKLLTDVPPVVGNVAWLGQEIHRLAEARGVKSALPKKELPLRKLKIIET